MNASRIRLVTAATSSTTAIAANDGKFESPFDSVQFHNAITYQSQLTLILLL